MNITQKIKNKPIFRLLKVLYCAGWVLVIMVTLLVFYITKPTGQIIENKSSFTCPNGKSFIWKDLDGYYSKKDNILNEKDHSVVMATCEVNTTLKNKLTGEIVKVNINDLSKYNITNESAIYGDRLNPFYKLNWITDNTVSKWLTAIFWSFIAFVITGFLLDTIKNIVMYIMYNEPFTYKFLKYL